MTDSQPITTQQLTIDQRLAQIKSAYAAHLQEEEEQKRLEAEREQQRKSIDLQQLISRIYSNLAEEIYASCGLEDKLNLYVSNNYCLRGDDSEAAEQKILECTGWKVTVCEKKQDYLQIDMSTEPKIYVLQEDTDDRSKKIIELDFPRLKQENLSRRKFWREFLPNFAATIITKCQQHLEKTPRRFYGIPEKFTVLDADGRTPFSGKFQFFNVQCGYGCLTDSQLQDLTAEINSRIDHGDILIERGDSYADIIWLYFSRSPEKPPVANPLFDYQTYYEKYDRVTPELQEVLNEIAGHAHFAYDSDQIKTLQADRALYYCFNSERSKVPKFAELKGLLEGRPHEQALISTINAQFPGIAVTEVVFSHREERWASCRGCAHGVHSLDEKIVFKYHIADDSSAGVRTQLETEYIIKYILDHQWQEMTEQLITMLLDKVEQLGIENVIEYQRSITFDLRLIHLCVPLNNQAQTIREINLDLDDLPSKTIEQLEAAVEQRTEGLFKVRIRSKTLYFGPSWPNL